MLDAREAVKIPLGINGGGAVSILALIGGLLTQKSPQLIEPVAENLRYFAGGVLGVGLTAMLVYVTNFA